MNRDSESESKGWWQTLPGLLTACAAVITALGGLLLAVHQTGFFDLSSQPAAQTQSGTAPIGEKPDEVQTSASSQAAPGGLSRQLTVSGNTQVRSGQAVYDLLQTRLDPYSPDKVSLHLSVRMTNNDRFDANFWAASFRLLVDGSLQPPTNNLDELVPAHSAKEGVVEFVIPVSVSTVGLQMGDVGDGKPAIPISLQSSQRSAHGNQP